MSCTKWVKHVLTFIRKHWCCCLFTAVIIAAGIYFFSRVFLAICETYCYLIGLYFIICLLLFLFWCRWGKREARKSVQPPVSVVGRSLARRDLYSAAIQLIIHAENITWTRSSNFLLANSILMLAWATIFASSLCDQRKAVFLSLLSGLGFVLSFVWAPFSYRSRRYLKAYRESGITLEQNLSPPLHEGPLSKGEKITFSYFEEAARSGVLTVVIPLTFAAVFLAALLKSLCLIATYIL